MSIFTGHASIQAPQSDDAKGSSPAASIPFRWGVMTAPIGPWYTHP